VTASTISAPSRRIDSRTSVALSVVAAMLLLALAAVSTPRVFDLLIIALLFACMAMGLQLVVGFCQLFDLGYAGFVCLGAYSTGVLLTRFHWNYPAAAITSILISLAAGVILGAPTLRLRGDYFAIVTFGFAEVVVLLMRNWTALTGGPFGLGGIPDPVLFGIRLNRYPPVGYYCLLLAISTALLLSVWYLRRTMLGGQMLAVGDDEKLCAINGIDVVAVKVCAFALSAGIGGLIGSFWAIYFKFLSYLDFTFTLSVQAISIVILAGDRRLRSLLVAAAIVAPANEILRTWLRSSRLPESSRVILVGVILILLSVWRSRELSSRVGALIGRLTGGMMPSPRANQSRPSVAKYDIQHPPAVPAPFLASEVSPASCRSLEPLLVIRGLDVSFGGTKALTGLEMAVNAGEVVAVIGPNGCGKTSLLNAISGLVSSTGQMILNGVDITHEPAWSRSRRGINRTLQTARRFSGLDEAENIELAAWAAAQNPTRNVLARIATIARAAVAWLHHGHSCHAHGSDSALSSRIQMARAFARPGTLVLLDEPLAGLKEADRIAVLTKIARHRASAGAVVVVEHDLESIFRVCDSIVRLDKGRVVFSGPKHEFQLLAQSGGKPANE